jgi:hypothetical protein
MSKTLPSEIQILEPSPDVRRYVLPRRELGGLRWVGLIPIGIGLVFIWFGISWILDTSQWLQGKIEPFSLVFSLFGVAFVYGGLLPFGIGLAMMIGHSEIEIAGGRLKTVERAGPLWWSRRRSLDIIQELKIEYAGPENEDNPRPRNRTDGLWAIRIRYAGRKPWLAAIGYPRALLLPLADDLAERLRESSSQPIVVDDQAVESGDGIFDGSLVPIMPERFEKPPGSRIELDERDGQLTINVPAAGLRRGSSGLFSFAIIWCSGSAFMTAIALVPILMDGDHWATILAIAGFMSFFWAVGIGILLVSINMGRRRAGIVVVGDRLSVLQTSLFGSKTSSWAADELRSVRVGPSGMKVNDRPVPELQVLPRTGKKLGMLAGRDVNELEWMASHMARALALKPVDTTSSELPDTEQPPASSRVSLERVPGGLTISVPAQGVRGAPLVLLLLGALFVGISILVGGGIMAGGGGGFAVIPGLFTLVGGAIVAAGLYQATVRTEIAVAGGRMLITSSSWFGQKSREWSREDVSRLYAGASSTSVNDQPLMELRVESRESAAFNCLTGREDQELAWIATVLRRELELDAQSPVS